MPGRKRSITRNEDGEEIEQQAAPPALNGRITESRIVEDGDVTYITMTITLQDAEEHPGLLIARYPTADLEEQYFQTGQEIIVSFPEVVPPMLEDE